MGENMRRMAERVEWIKAQLRGGHHWNSSLLAETFGVSAKTAARTVATFRRVFPDWLMGYDARERSFYLAGDLDIEKPCRRPGRLDLAADEFLEIRHHIGLTQAQLARCIETGAAQVSAWELGKSMIPAEVALLMRAWDRAASFGFWQGRTRKIYRK
ncbi:hypothetical protein DSCO28_73050 (plasmid) [Desulfosarcina ovata subsp. sediminis]|uniref:Uncharacterized protein n=1 Tax=Desulfosarcina ovata subsp. sediminis TaxID=885957 RepID=A0A5K8A2H4_9BACT|nr:hypothetical protein DSCO28_73050 [Desulfosarcina ovata subsp. sediminis]